MSDTDLYEYYKKNPFKILSLEEYGNILISCIKHLRPDIVINRITGDPAESDLIEPTWLLKKVCLLNDIDKEMKKRNTYQGIKVTSKIYN